MRAMIRSTETFEVSVEGEGLPEIHAKLADAKPDGFDLVKAPVAMAKASTTITAVGTYQRRDQTREIKGGSIAELEAQTPEGWQMLYVLA